MAATLKDIAAARIRQHGPMDIGAFMALALGHPVHGYYIRCDPLGAAGDFTTAPEISQMFGELIGAWTADIWTQMGRPARFVLLECGPGRGTLMADAVGAARGAEGFQDAAEIHLLETSPVLREKQARALDGFRPIWHDTLETVPADLPLIVLANEFLDALPVRQFMKEKNVWYERVVCLDPDDAFTFGFVAAPPAMMPYLPRDAGDGDIHEIAPAREAFVRNLSRRLEEGGGAALLIDYGYDSPGPGDTLQAVRAHAFAPVLERPGEADLTAHVDFSALALAADGLDVSGPVGQGAFLDALGLGVRAEKLAKGADGPQSEKIRAARDRLASPEQMGTLFRVMALCSRRQNLKPAGFQEFISKT